MLLRQIHQRKLLGPVLTLLVSAAIFGCNVKGPRFTYTTVVDDFGSQALGADVVTPETAAPEDGFPVVLMIHGGGWGSKTLYDDGISTTINTVAQAGYVGVTIDYRLAIERVNESNLIDPKGATTRNEWPAQIQDAKCAVRWIRAKANDTTIFPKKINPDKIGVLGISAGGQLALMLGETADVSAFENSNCEHNASSDVQAVVSYAALADVEGAWGTGQNLIRPMYQNLLSLWNSEQLITTNFNNLSPDVVDALNSASPSYFVGGNTTPVRLIHAINDILAPPAASSCFYNAAASANRDSSMLWFGTGGHLFDSGTRVHADAQMLNWFDKHLKGVKSELACTACVTPTPAQIACPWN